MGLRCGEFGDCVGQCGKRSDMENGIRVFSVIQTAVIEDDGEKVKTGLSQ